jgi:hypothetical protein
LIVRGSSSVPLLWPLLVFAFLLLLLALRFIGAANRARKP